MERQSTESAIPRREQVEGTLEYLSPHSTLNRRYVAPGAELNAGQYDRHTVVIRNARPVQGEMSLASHGFTIVHHPSAVADFKDRQQLETVYRAEIEHLVRQETGADRVVAFAWTVRNAAHTGAEVQPPATDVHVDYASDRAEGLARAMLRQAGTPEFKFRRFVAINLWRALSAPPQDWPLALCDGRSVDPAEGVRNAMIRVGALPEKDAIPAQLADDPARPEAFVFHFNPLHRWYYFPDMGREELLLFKLYDSNRTGAWRVPHASFADPTVRNAAPRESVEIRTVAYFS